MTADSPIAMVHDEPRHAALRLAGEDEWGFFDPERHGLAAVRARLGFATPTGASADEEPVRWRSPWSAFDDE